MELRQMNAAHCGIGLQPCSNSAATNKLQPASLFGARSPHLPYHRALPRLSSVTESIALPPRPERRPVFASGSCPGIAADLFCTADRRYDAYSVVIHFGGPAQSAQANRSVAPIWFRCEGGELSSLVGLFDADLHVGKSRNVFANGIIERKLAIVDQHHHGSRCNRLRLTKISDIWLRFDWLSCPNGALLG